MHDPAFWRAWSEGARSVTRLAARPEQRAQIGQERGRPGAARSAHERTGPCSRHDAGGSTSSAQMGHSDSSDIRLRQYPSTIRLDDLDVLCAVLECSPAELLLPEPDKVAARRPPKAQAASPTPITPRLGRHRSV